MSEITTHAAPIVFQLESREIIARLTANDKASVFEAIVTAIAAGKTPTVKVTGGISIVDLLRAYAADFDPSPRLSAMLDLPSGAPRSQIAAEAGARLANI